MSGPDARPGERASGPDGGAARETEWTRWAVGPDEPLDRLPYLRILDRPSLGPVEVVYGRVRIRRSGEGDVDLVAGWLGEKRVFGPLGFPRPIGRDFIARSVVPDLTGGAEPVDFLIVEDAPSRRTIGFLVCYEALRPEDPDQEVDFALPVHGFGTPRWVRAIRTAMLTYLFCLCGARSVSWVRMRRTRPDAPERLGDADLFLERGAAHRVSRTDYRAILERIARTRSRSQWPSVRRPAGKGTPGDLRATESRS